MGCWLSGCMLVHWWMTEPSLGYVRLGDLQRYVFREHVFYDII